MKALVAAVLAFVLIGAAANDTRAQASRVEGPDYIGVFEARTASGRVALERQKAQGAYKVRALGFAGLSGFYQIAGERSSVRFKAGEPVSFVVRTESQQTDPATLFQISRLEVKRGQRILPSVTVGYSSSNKMAAQAVPFDATKYGSQFFKLTPTSSLVPGEYLVSAVLPQDAANAGSRDVFLFGVD